MPDDEIVEGALVGPGEATEGTEAGAPIPFEAAEV